MRRRRSRLASRSRQKGPDQTGPTYYLDLAVYYGFHFLVFVIPLIFLPFSYDVFDLTKVTFLRIGTIFLLVCWIIKMVVSDEISIKRTQFDLPILVFIIAATIATFTSVHPPTSILGKYESYEGLTTLLIYASLFFLASQTFSDEKRARALQRTMVLTALIVAIYGLAQYFGYDFITWAEELFEARRSSSTLGNPVFLAGYLSLILPISISLLVCSLDNRSFLPSTFYLLSTILITIVLVFTYSRGGWLAGLVGLFVLSLLLGRKIFFRKKILYLLLALVLLIGSVFLIDYKMTSPGQVSLVERISSLPKIGEGSIATRLLTWQSTLKAITKRPIFGWGPDTFHFLYPPFGALKLAQLSSRGEQPDNAHNYFLQLASTQGMFGLLAFLSILVVFFTSIPPNHPTTQPAPPTYYLLPTTYYLHAGLAAGITAYLFYLLSGINGVDTGTIFWISLGLFAAGRIPPHPPLEKGGTRGDLKGARPLFLALIIFLSLAGIWQSARLYLADFHFLQAERVLVEEGNFESAISQYNSAIQLNPYQNLYRLSLGRLYAEAAQQSKEKLFFDRAEDIYLEAERVTPLELDNYIFLGDLYLKGGQFFHPRYYSLAEVQLRQALKMSPHWADSHALLGMVYWRTGRLEKAIKEFEKVLETDPKDAQVYFYLGRIYQRLGDEEKARQAYIASLRLDPSNEAVEQALLELGNVAERSL